MNKTALHTRTAGQADGIRARIKREVFAAATTPRDAPGRDERLSFWHDRQRAADRIYYRNHRKPYPTREQRADAREMAKVGSWLDSAEYRAEQRQMGFGAL